MATTYLELTNQALRELNEIPLTSANFGDAVGLQQFVKDSINKSIFDIANEEPQLPFFAVSASGGTDPFYGNVTVATVAGQRWYTLKAGSSDITTDFASIDWDDFYATTINVSGETSPFVSKSLKYITLDNGIDFISIESISLDLLVFHLTLIHSLLLCINNPF